MSEFNIIEKYFTWENPTSDIQCADDVDGDGDENVDDCVDKNNGIIQDIGDDAAILNVPENQYLVTSVDTSIAGIHFPESTSGYDIGYKSLAVNLSDLAAMGATAKWFTLALTLPSVDREEDKQWLDEFSRGLKDLSKKTACALVGGDTTHGHLSITIQVMGLIDKAGKGKKSKALLRRGAKLGDKIYVTGTLGDASAGLATILAGLKLQAEDQAFCRQRLNKPIPRLNESQTIKNFATSCIDLSDGLLQDLGHILKASDVGARIDTQSLPFSPALQKIDKEVATQFALSGGDDYELLFTIPANKETAFLKAMPYPASCIGEITDNAVGVVNGSNIVNEKGKALKKSGYNHFA